MSNKKVIAHVLMAALQVKAGNPRKAQRLLAEFDDDEVQDAVEETVDLVEESELSDDPFLVGEEASEDEFDLSPEDEEADLGEDEDDEDEDEVPAETARLRRRKAGKQTASARRQNNMRLIQMASVGKRKVRR